ncbi:MAG: hypothetical protein ACREXP_20900 [Steroidobacteraceae bacterium]
MTSRRDFLWLAAASSFDASVHAAGARHTVAQTPAGKIGGAREHGVHLQKRPDGYRVVLQRDAWES